MHASAAVRFSPSLIYYLAASEYRGNQRFRFVFLKAKKYKREKEKSRRKGEGSHQNCFVIHGGVATPSRWDCCSKGVTR